MIKKKKALSVSCSVRYRRSNMSSFYRNIQINENDFSWIKIHFFLYINEYTLFYDTLSIYTFVKVSGLIRKNHMFVQYEYIHMGIEIK